MSYKNILLIDDDEDDQEIFMAALELCGINANCIAIPNAIEALNRLNNGLVPDVIFLDLNMPQMNGHQFLTEFHRSPTPALAPVYVLSTSSHHTAINQSKRLGAKGFITKPDKFEELIDILRSILNPS